MSLNHFMSWEGGVDLVAMTREGLSTPNVVMHVARMVHTPVGSAASGMVLWQPDPDADPILAGFVSADAQIGYYFGPNIFAGTPFEGVPVLDAEIEVTTHLPSSVESRIEVEGHVFEVKLAGLGATELVNREPAEATPFQQQGLEAAAERATLRVDGEEIPLVLPPAGIGGGPAAVWAPAGIYAR